MHLIAPSLALSVLTAPAIAQTAASGDHCSQQSSTPEIVQCHNQQAKLWDRRLNNAYQALRQRVDPGQREPLTVAQRLWIRYRDANCSFYAAGEGTISRVLSADCVRSMTRQRACELESAGNWEAESGAGCRQAR